MKLWCRKTSQPFLSAFGASQSSPQLQMDDDGYSPQSILTSKCKQIVRVHKHKGWGQNKRAEDWFSLIETAEKIPGNSRDTCQHRYSTLRENTMMHRHKQLLSRSLLLLHLGSLSVTLCDRVYEGNCVTPVTHYK